MKFLARLFQGIRRPEKKKPQMPLGLNCRFREVIPPEEMTPEMRKNPDLYVSADEIDEQEIVT